MQPIVTRKIHIVQNGAISLRKTSPCQDRIARCRPPDPPVGEHPATELIANGTEADYKPLRLLKDFIRGDVRTGRKRIRNRFVLARPHGILAILAGMPPGSRSNGHRPSRRRDCAAQRPWSRCTSEGARRPADRGIAVPRRAFRPHAGRLITPNACTRCTDIIAGRFMHKSRFMHKR